MIDLTEKLLALYPPKPNKVGRYSCSKIYAILHGWITPEQYINGEAVDFIGAFRMWQGTKKHEQIQELLKDDYIIEEKREKKVKDFEIVGMADLMTEDTVLDIKTSFKLINAKPWAVHQVKLYLTLFERPFGEIVQPIWTGNKLYLKTLGKYKRDDDFFNKQMDLLAKFHELCLKK